MVKEKRKRIFAILVTLAMLISIMPVVMPQVKALTVGTTDGTYDFGGLGTVDSAGSGYQKLGDKFKVQNNMFWATTSLGVPDEPLAALYPDETSTTVILQAEGSETCGSFTFKNLGFSAFTDMDYPSDKSFTAFNIVLKDNIGNELLNESLGASAIISSTEIVQLNTLYSRSEWNVGGVSTIELTYSLSSGDSTYLTFENITVANVTPYMAAPSITAQPSNVTVNAGGSTSFTVAAAGATSYQWQVNTGSGFVDISNGGVYSNATTATLNITGATADMNGYQYKVVVSGSAEPAATSNAAILTVNSAPTDIALSATSVNENVVDNTTVGMLSSDDPDASNTFTYTLVDGEGSTDNTAFNINGTSMRITNSPDYETKNSYSVRIRTTDQGGQYYEETFTITINDLNESPTDITLSPSFVDENVAANTVLGTLSTADPDTGNTFTYTLVSGAGSTDNASFNISSNSLRITNSPDYETKSSYSVRIRTTDQGALFFEKSFTITINNINEPPTVVANTGVIVNEGTNTVIAKFNLEAADVDTAATSITYTLTAVPVSGTIKKSGTALELDGTFTQADINNNLITYTHNGSETDSDSFTFTVSDGAGGSIGATTFNITVIPENDAPVLDNSGTMTLTTITEDNDNPDGNTVAVIVGDRITDEDSGAVEGIAVTELSGEGTWQYNIGSGWTAIGVVSSESALLLNDTAAVRFVPTASYNNAQTSTITFRAWDQTSGTPGTKVDASTNGGTAAFSTDTVTASIEVAGINDDPAITGRPSSITVTENTESNVDLSAASFGDPDSGANNISLTLSVSSGTLTAADGGEVTADGSGTATVTLTGTESNIDIFLNTASNIQYTGEAGTYGLSAATLTLTANDGGYAPTGTGGGEDVSLGTVSINITAIAPTVTNVTSDNDNKTYGLGETIEIQVVFSHAVVVTGTPQLTLATVVGNRTASYLSGSGSDTLTFTYTTQAGDETSDLDYASISALNLNGGTIMRDTTPAVLTLPSPGAAGSLGANKAIAIEAYPTVSLSVSPASIDENGGTSTITATLSAISSQDVTLLLSYSGNATVLSDYGPTSGSITIPAGNSWANAAVDITAINDTDTEGDETIVVSIASVSRGISDDVPRTITILDDDIPTVTNVSSSTVNSSYKAGDVISIQVTFSEDVTVDTTGGTPQLMLETGTTDRTIDYSFVSGNTLTFNYTVQAGDNSNNLNYVGTDSLTLNGGTITSSGVNARLTLPTPGAPGSLGANKTIVVDTTPPTVTVAVSDAVLKVGETSTVTIDFSEAVTSFSGADMTAANGALSVISSSDGGITWTARLTPTADVEDTTNVITLYNTGVTDAAGNTGVGVTNSNNYAIDTKRPTATITVSDTVLKADETTTVTIDFSEAITGLTTADLTASSAMLSNLTTSNNITWTATLTPTADVEDDSNVITLDNTGVQDAAGNTGGGTTASNNYAIDTKRPTAGNSGTIGVSDLTYNSAKLTWTKASDTATLEENLQYKVVFSTSDIMDVDTANLLSGIWTPNITTLTATGLTANTDYYFNVLVKDEVGNMVLYSSVTGTTTAAPVYDDTPSTQTPPTSAIVEVNGEKQDAGELTTETKGETTTTTITVDDMKLNNILEQKGNNVTVTLPVSGNPDAVVGQLTGQTVKNMENKEATLEIKTGTVTYTLPASQINISAVSSQLGAQVELKDIKVSVKIAEPPADTVKIVEDTASRGNYQLVVKPVEFEITCTSGERTVQVSRFNGYVERTIAIPDGIDPSKITTGIVLNADGTFSHVPTQIIVIGGKYYAKINSLTNSTYSVVYNPVIFTDMANHWAKDAVNKMGSRMVVAGIGNDIYEPERSITRAEFAAIVVRALGLKKGTSESAFGDVTLADWFNGYVDTATSYSLIKGYDSESFAPNDTITREQAMTILARAMKLTGLSVTLADGKASALLAGYTDGASVSSYAKVGVEACIKTGVVTGTTASTLSPKDSVTRAEVAVMVRRLLEKSGLI